MRHASTTPIIRSSWNATSISKVKTAVSEQTFSWLRNHAGTSNELCPAWHRFLVLVYATEHNRIIEKGSTQAARPFRGKGAPFSVYSCGRKVTNKSK